MHNDVEQSFSAALGSEDRNEDSETTCSVWRADAKDMDELSISDTVDLVLLAHCSGTRF